MAAITAFLYQTHCDGVELLAVLEHVCMGLYEDRSGFASILHVQS